MSSAVITLLFSCGLSQDASMPLLTVTACAVTATVTIGYKLVKSLKMARSTIMSVTSDDMLVGRDYALSKLEAPMIEFKDDAEELRAMI